MATYINGLVILFLMLANPLANASDLFSPETAAGKSDIRTPYFLAENTVSKSANSQKSIKKSKRRAPMVILSTNYGDMTIELYPDDAPVTVENFLKYVDDGYYNDTIFHRVMSGFMIQGGGFTQDMVQKKPRDPIKNEADNGLKNTRGTLSMARTQVVDSATSQFFLNVADNDFLDHGGRDFGYAVFAKVVEGMDVADKIAATATGNQGGHGNVPLEPVIINEAKRKD